MTAYIYTSTCPCHAQQDPAEPSAVCCPSPLLALSSTGFPPIPGLEPTAGTEEDAVAATLAAAQKLAALEDAAAAEEDGDEDEVWLRARGWWGENGT